MFEVKERLVVTPSAPFLPAGSATVAAPVAPKARRPAADPSIDHRVGPSAVWQPASSARIQVVESLVVLGTMAYFAYGLAAVFGLL